MFRSTKTIIPYTPSLSIKEMLQDWLKTQVAICVITHRHHVKDGIGDLLFAIKLHTFLKTEFPNVTLHAFSEYEQKSFQELTPPLTVANLDEAKKISQQQKTLFICGPVPNNGEIKMDEKSSFETWAVHEYNMVVARKADRAKNEDGSYKAQYSRVIKTGIGPGFFGINCDQWLHHIKMSLKKQNKLSDPERLYALQNIPLKTLLQNQDLKSYDNHLFFGYSHSTIMKMMFISSILTQMKDTKDIDICLLGGLEEGSIFGDNMEEIFKSDFISKKLNGFREVEFYDWSNDSKEYKTSSRKIDNASTRKLRIISPNQLSQQDFLNLMIASHPFTLVTGDQSLAQAIILGKIFYYDKIKPPLYTALLALAETLTTQEAATFLEQQPARQYLSKPLLFNSAELLKSFDELSEAIYKKYNLEANVKEAIYDWMINTEKLSELKRSHI